jgi:hypothetical protein
LVPLFAQLGNAELRVLLVAELRVLAQQQLLVVSVLL